MTNLQQTGQTAGIAQTTFALDPVAGRVDLAWRSDAVLEARCDGRVVVVDPRRARVLEGADFVRVVPDERARPGNLITWAVDRVRALSWFGDDRMQWVKAVAFTALDKMRSTFSGAATAEDIREEIGLPATAGPSPVTFTDPEVGWPPAPIKPVLPSPLAGEGQWIPLDKDPFITPTASGTPAAFVTSFIRPDPHRADVRVYVTLWDPRQIALHMEAGTIEPISATGEHGSGMIPRVPEVMDHVVAAFNGGFQAQHGEYGMQANGIEYLPPKPYAATVVEFRNGANGFGAWPASASVPEDVIGMRQNLDRARSEREVQPVGTYLVGRGAARMARSDPHGAQRDLPDGRGLRRLLLQHEHLRGRSRAGDARGALLVRHPPRHERGARGLRVLRRGARRAARADGTAATGRLGGAGEGPRHAGVRVPRAADDPGDGAHAFPSLYPAGSPRFLLSHLTCHSSWRARGHCGRGHEEPEPGEGQWRTRGLPQHGFPYATATTWVRARAVEKIESRRTRVRPRRPTPESG